MILPVHRADPPDRPAPRPPGQPASRPDVRRLEPAERDDAIESVVAAFATDPLLRWVWPEDERYQRCAPAMFSLLLDLRRAGGEVWAAERGAAVAMWEPPGGLIVTPATDPWPAVQEAYLPAEKARWETYEQALAVPADASPYWYLGVLATHPDRQGRGLGRAVVAPVLAAATRARAAAYLETASEANVGFYLSLGFVVEREAALPDGGPVCWLMRRDQGAADA